LKSLLLALLLVFGAHQLAVYAGPPDLSVSVPAVENSTWGPPVYLGTISAASPLFVQNTAGYPITIYRCPSGVLPPVGQTSSLTSCQVFYSSRGGDWSSTTAPLTATYFQPVGWSFTLPCRCTTAFGTRDVYWRPYLL
jgi:hypothetical protein